MKSFSEVIKEFNRTNNFKERLEEARAIEAWGRVITDDIAKNTDPKYIRNGVLYIKTTSPTWAQELSGFSPRLKELLNDYLGAAIVREIKFSCQVFKKAPTEEAGEDKPRLGDIAIGEQDLSEAAEATAPIGDDELRERLMSLIIQSKKLNRWRNTEGWKICGSCGRHIPPAEKRCRRCSPK